MNKITSILILTFFSLTITGIAQTTISKSKLNFGKKIVLNSKIVDENFEIWLRLPNNFEKAKDSLSLLVLLDGDEYFKMASDVVELYEWSKKMPATVILALPSTGESRYKYYTPSNVAYKGKNKQDSLLWKKTGNFKKFAEILNTELIPEISKQLQAKFVSKTIFGHSNGGLGALSFYTLKPNIFDNYIVASPAILWDNFYIQKKITNEKKENPLYMTLGTKHWDYEIESYKEIINLLSKTNSKFKFVENNQENHPTNGLRTLLDGLIFVYKKNE
jgi:predicted alpha/beta superfamily hydrolase